jgi:hypothetical protein
MIYITVNDILHQGCTARLRSYQLEEYALRGPALTRDDFAVFRRGGDASSAVEEPCAAFDPRRSMDEVKYALSILRPLAVRDRKHMVATGLAVKAYQN